jgi:putative ABC transport system substrate-binding protein
LPALAADLVRRRVNLILAAGSTPAIAAKSATATIPIVFYAGGDPVGLGLVPSFNRPEGNITGVARVSHALAAKRLELLDEIVPKNARISVLIHAENVNTAADVKELEQAAHIVGRQTRIFSVSSNADIDTAFESMAAQRDGAVLVNAGRFFEGQRERLVALAANRLIPAIYDQREYVDVGGLMSYGGSVVALYQQAGGYAGRILKGEKPIDLPVQQPTRFELVLNLKTAKALGLEIPPMLLALADEVIE